MNTSQYKAHFPYGVPGVPSVEEAQDLMRYIEGQKTIAEGFVADETNGHHWQGFLERIQRYLYLISTMIEELQAQQSRVNAQIPEQDPLPCSIMLTFYNDMPVLHSIVRDLQQQQLADDKGHLPAPWVIGELDIQIAINLFYLFSTRSIISMHENGHLLLHRPWICGGLAAVMGFPVEQTSTIWGRHHRIDAERK